jgi:hypothetical protein
MDNFGYSRCEQCEEETFLQNGSRCARCLGLASLPIENDDTEEQSESFIFDVPAAA